MDTSIVLKVTIIDVFDEIHEINFKPYEYPNLMELIINNYYEEIGDCGGKGLCGTCYVQPILDLSDSTKDSIKNQTFNQTQNSNKTDHLACQIMVNEKIDGMSFKIINEN